VYLAVKKFNIFSEIFLTGTACPGNNVVMESLRTIKEKHNVPFMARVFRGGDARTALREPHKARATNGIFRALHGKRGVIWNL